MAPTTITDPPTMTNTPITSWPPIASNTPVPEDVATTVPSTEPSQTPTPTGSIIETTPLGGDQPSPSDHWQGLPDGTLFRTYGTVNVRDCASTDCPVIDRYGPGKTVEVSAIRHTYLMSEKWLCLADLRQIDKETTCPKAIAWIYKDQFLGELLWPDY
ncbi:MAG: hypothetical protein JXB07_18840 [Anaerolineae bacterium]|nr:hypothetical protein [Anaerolineae bacterium]